MTPVTHHVNASTLALRIWLQCGFAVIATIAACTSQLPAQSPSQSAGRTAAQLLSGTLVTPVAFFGAGWATKHLVMRSPTEADSAARAPYVAAYTATWLAAAAAPAVVGRDGRFGHALAGSAVGMAAAWAGVQLGNRLYDDDRRRCGALCWTLGAAVVALPSIGATVMYNASRR